MLRESPGAADFVEVKGDEVIRMHSDALFNFGSRKSRNRHRESADGPFARWKSARVFDGRVVHYGIRCAGAAAGGQEIKHLKLSYLHRLIQYAPNGENAHIPGICGRAVSIGCDCSRQVSPLRVIEQIT
jgi:hypothetical protein